MGDFKQNGPIRLETVAIRMKDREKMLWFYRDILGFSLKREENELAILGTDAEKNELLWLEETPYAEAYTGEIKKLQRLSLVIPSAEEMGDIMRRILNQGYPVTDALYDDGTMGILLEDPEGNQIEIYFGIDDQQHHHAPEPLDPDKLKARSTGEFPRLSEAVHFDKVHLNTSKLPEENDFLQNVLGLEVRDEREGILVLNEGNFHIGLNEGQGGTLERATDDVLGLDFLKFSVTKDALLKLEAHLTELGSEFYIDKKKSILTIYDPAGIEWWFLAKKI